MRYAILGALIAALVIVAGVMIVSAAPSEEVKEEAVDIAPSCGVNTIHDND